MEIEKLQDVPKTLQFAGVQPQAFPTRMKINKWLPQGNVTEYGIGDQIRFIINAEGYLDPYSTYLNIEVELKTDGLQPKNCLQLDGSAHSLINKMVIKTGNQELERIEEYDQLAQVLIDSNYSIEGRAQLTNQGVGFNAGAVNIGNPAQRGFAVDQNANPVPIQNNDTWDQNSETFGEWLGQWDASRSPNVKKQGKNGIWDIPWVYSFAGGCNEPRMASDIDQPCILQGKPTTAKITKMQFCIPILSGILGILMPAKSHKLLPLSFMKNLILELSINPYAFFTPGYYQPTNDDDIEQSKMYRRDAWKISGIELVGEVIELEQDTDVALRSVLQAGGFVMHTNSWMKGPSYSLAANQSPFGSYQVNQGFESLRSIFVIFNDLVFQDKSFCRKNYRLSHCITDFQVKVGLDYYPSQPIRGNGGNVSVNPDSPQDGNNSEFIINYQKAFGKYIDIKGDCFINSANFALNNRGYDPMKTNSPTVQNPNVDTWRGLPFYHENRCVGKAVYAIDLEALNYNPNEISGINTTDSLPYEINFKSMQQSGVAFERSSVMHIFQLFDCIIRFEGNGYVQVLGRV